MVSQGDFDMTDLRWGVPFLRGVFVGVFLKGIGFPSAFPCSEVLVSSVTSALKSSRMDWGLLGMYLNCILFRSSFCHYKLLRHIHTYNIWPCFHLVLRSFSDDLNINGQARQIAIYTWKWDASHHMWAHFIGRVSDFMTTYITFYACYCLLIKCKTIKSTKTFVYK